MRAEAERQEYEGKVNAIETDFAACRHDYRVAYQRFEKSMHAAIDAFEEMATARNAEHLAARRMVKANGDTNPAAFMRYLRLPTPRTSAFGTDSTQPKVVRDTVERSLRATQPRD